MSAGVSALKFDQREAEVIFKLAAQSGSKLILIGGQAVNFWASTYQKVEPTLRAGPFASKDIDVQAEAEALRNCARALQVTPEMVRAGEPTPFRGRIVYVLDGREC